MATNADSNSFHIEWVIEQSYMNPNLPISSPSFKIMVLGGTMWKLTLKSELRCDGNFMTLQLLRESDNSDIDKISVDFRSSMSYGWTAFDGDIEVVNKYFTRGEFMIFKIHMIGDHSALSTSEFLLQDITVKCSLSPSNTEISKWIDCKLLSEDLLNLYESKAFADVILCSGDIEIKAHRFVLAARLPKLAQEWNITELETLPLRKQVSISPPVIRHLLQYAYLGQISNLSPDSYSELNEVASLFDLLHLLKPHANSCCASTTFNIRYENFQWSINSEHLLKGQEITFNRYLTISCLYIDLDVSLKASVNLYYKTLSSLDIKISVIGFSEEKPVFLRYSVLVGNYYDQKMLFRGGHVFKKNGDYNKSHYMPHTFLDLDIHKTINLSIQMNICDGILASDVVSTCTDFLRQPPSIKDFTDFIKEMKSILTQNCVTDFSIISDGEVISTHRALLAARSPVFDRMLHTNMIESRTGMIEIVDFKLSALKFMLFYLYTGTVTNAEYDIICDSYIAADKYQVVGLKKRCAKLLELRLSIDNYEEVSQLATLYSDSELQRAVDNFIRDA